MSAAVASSSDVADTETVPDPTFAPPIAASVVAVTSASAYATATATMPTAMISDASAVAVFCETEVAEAEVPFVT